MIGTKPMWLGLIDLLIDLAIALIDKVKCVLFLIEKYLSAFL